MKQKRVQNKAPLSTGARLRLKLERISETAAKIGQGSRSTGDLLRLVKAERDLCNQALDLAILAAREKGNSWAYIGDVLGLSAQAIEQRMRRLGASTHVDKAAAA